MIKTIVILLIFICSYALTEARQQAVAVQYVRVAPYEEALKGFESVCDIDIKRIVAPESEDSDIIGQINRIRPNIILAVGVEALSRVKKIKNIPIVYLMVLNPQFILGEEKNITGVSLNIPQEKQLQTLLNIFPNTEAIGLVYNPDKTGCMVKRVRDATQKVGIKLIAEQIHDSRDVPLLIEHMRNQADIFWMLPDITVITPETTEFLLLFSQENKIPILTFSEKYLELGALISIGIDAFDIGKQAGEMAKEILSGKCVDDVRQVDARNTIISINLRIAKKLKIHINENIIKKVRVVH
ncbi:MAG: hypothetical protein JW786_15440 [Desulfobacterales bacterium]|nr:hypothetical protein [Desulfobacterales bacterium]